MSITEFSNLANAHPWAYVALLFNFGVVLSMAGPMRQTV
jgi:hypothetical protein